MATSDVKVTEGSGKNVASYSVSEDAETKQIQRVTLNTSSGVEAGTATNPMPSNITNGTNVADVVPGDTGFNGVSVVAGVKTLTFTTSSSGVQTILANTDVRGYSWIEVVYTSVGSGLALTGQFSTVSGGTYVNSSTFTNSNGTSVPGVLGVTVGVIYAGMIRGNFFQIAVSALTSGTFAGTVTLRTVAPPYTAITANISTAFYAAIASSVPANAVYMGLSNSGNISGLNALTVGADAATGAGTAQVGPYVYNGTNFDRMRSANGSSNTTGTGLLGAGQMVWDGTNWQKQRADTSGVPTVNAGGVAGTALNTYSVRLTTNTTTTPTSSLAYISSITISSEVAGTTSTVTIKDKSGTPLVLVNGLTTVAASLTPTVINFQTPIKMTGGIDIVTAGAVAATVDIWINYYG